MITTAGGWFHRLGLDALCRRILVKDGRFAVVLHGVSAQRVEGVPREVQPSFSAGELEAALAWIGARFGFLSPEAFLRGEPGVLLTLDDGLANNATNALPVLERFGAPAVFFASARHVRSPRDWLGPVRRLARSHWGEESKVPEALAADFFDGMSAEQLAACGRHPLVTIGGHSETHPLLTGCSDEALQAELVGSRRYLQQVSGQPVDLFAYPTGDYDRRVASAVRAAGYRAAFALDSRAVGMPAFEIPRVGLYGSAPGYLALKLSGLHRPPLQQETRYA